MFKAKITSARLKAVRASLKKYPDWSLARIGKRHNLSERTVARIKKSPTLKAYKEVMAADHTSDFVKSLGYAPLPNEPDAQYKTDGFTINKPTLMQRLRKRFNI